MLFPEQRFRQLCRQELGGYESVKFQKALDTDPGDPVSITFNTGWQETKTIKISRADAEQYAQWAAEEAAPEVALLEYIKPQMREWIRSHRPAMCIRLREAMEKYNPEYGKDVQLIWPIETPDIVPYETAVKYLEKYAKNNSVEEAWPTLSGPTKPKS